MTSLEDCVTWIDLIQSDSSHTLTALPSTNISTWLADARRGIVLRSEGDGRTPLATLLAERIIFSLIIKMFIQAYEFSLG